MRRAFFAIVASAIALVGIEGCGLESSSGSWWGGFDSEGSRGSGRGCCLVTWDATAPRDAGPSSRTGEWPAYGATCGERQFTGKLDPGETEHVRVRYAVDAPCGPEPKILSENDVHLCVSATCSSGGTALQNQGVPCLDGPGTLEPRWECPPNAYVSLVTLAIRAGNDRSYSFFYVHAPPPELELDAGAAVDGGDAGDADAPD